ncbi:SasC/FmtB family protein [Staphylococcus haemolyticus]
MNLFKKQKFSIRKFSVGIFSTVIATLTFLSHPGHAATQEEESNSSQATSQNVKSQTDDKSIHNNDNYIENEKNSNDSIKEIATAIKINNSEINSKVDNANGTYRIDNEEIKENSIETNQDEKTIEPELSHQNISKNDSNNTFNENKSIHKRTKRSTDNNVDNNQDQMSINETNSGQIINGTFTDTSNGAVIPTNQTVSEMNQAGKITGWHVKDNDQTEIPLVWGPKALPPYNPYVFDKTNNKIAAVLSKYPNNLGGVAGDKTVGPIYQDVDVTPGSEVQLYFIGTSMGNTNGINGVKVSIYDSNNPTDLLYSGRPNTASKSFGVFTGVFNVPNNVSRLRFMFETFEKRSYESANGGRILKGKNNFGGSGLADVKVNSGAYLKATTTQTKYTVTSPSTSTSLINATLEVSLENKGHSRSNKTQYKVVLPEGVQFISAQNARANYNSSNRLLTLNVDRIEPGTIKNITYTVSLPTSEPIKKDFDATLVYVTDGINMNRRNGSRDFGSNADDNYFRYGGYNEYVKTESNQRRGNVTVATQSVTVEMYKTDLQQKYNQISAQIEHLNPSDYSQEAWSSMQNVLNASRQILNENDNTPINDRKNQATINDLTLRLDKERAKLDVDQAAKSRKEVINNNNDATREEKDTALTLLKATFDEKVRDIESATNINEISERKKQAIVDISPIDVIPAIKQQAIQSLNDKADEKLIEIENDTNATFEEREEAKTSVNEALTNAKNAVRNATTNQLVETVLTSNSNNISQISTHAIARDKARQELDRVIASKMSEIDNDHSATIEEKNETKAKIDEIAKQARLNIERGVHNDDVKVAKDKALNQLHNVQVDAIKKNQAKQIITDQANSKKAEIDQTPNATDEEKAAAKAKVDEAVTTAKNAIDQATNNDGVDTAKTNGVDTINNVQPTVVKKDEAKTAIDKAAEAKKAEIDQTPDATDEEKAAAKAKVDEAVNNAKASIDQATNNNGVDTAKSEGSDAINHVQPVVVKKDEAKTAIDKAAEAKKAEIDQTPNATDEEKVAAKAKVDEAVTTAKNAIDQATNNAGVDTAKSNGLDSINNIQPTVVKKDEAKTAIDKAAEAKKAEIDQTPNATDEEKAAAKAKVDEAVTTAKNAIDQATNNNGVDTTKTNGVDAINNVQPTVVKKDEAKTAIDKAAEAKKAEIDQTPDATDEEKAAAKAKVDEAVNNAKASIDQVTNNEGVDTAKSNGLDSINNIQPTVVKKDEAKTAIDKAAEAKKAEIDQTPNATDEEKAAAKAKVDEAVTTAKNAIDQATNNAGVDTAKTNGVDTINNIQPTVVKKDEAKTAIENAARAKKAEIDQTPNATDEEKATAKAKVDEAVTTAKNAIDQATNNDGVDTAKSEGSDAINHVQPVVVKKDEAKTAIDKAAEAKKAEIDQTPNATDEEKIAAKAKVDEAVTTAKNAIDQATNNAGVDTAKSNGLDSINNIQPTVVKKDEAKTAIDKAAEAKKAEIDQTPNATDEEKAAAKAKIDEAVNNEKASIDQATNNDGVDTAKSNGLDSINNIQPTVVKKDEAKAAINKAAEAKKAEIDQTPNATDEEKVAAKAKVDEAVTTAKNAIDQATNNAGVDTAKSNGLDSINNIQPTVVKKDEAKAAIDKAAEAKKAEIDQTPNATDEEKAAAKAKVDEAVTTAKNAIDQATNNAGVDTAKTNGVDSINNVQPTVVKKDEAKTAIENAARAKKAEIDQTPNATDEEKVAAKAKVDEAVNNAKASIDQATNNDGVDTAKSNGLDSINNIQPTVVKKDEAKTAIDKAAEAKKAEIDQTPNATDEEKAAAKAKVDEAVTTAKNAIDQATNNAGVDTAKSNGLDSINNIQPTVVKKDEAKAAIDKAAEAKKAEIDQTPNATDEEKAAAKAKVDEAVTTAKNAIDQATNNAGVDTAKTNGVDSINNVQPTVVKKDEAKTAIENAARAKKAEIDQTPNATDEEKVAAKAKVDEAVNNAKASIDQATNNDGVDTAKSNGLDSINNIQPTVVKKDEAKTAIDKAAEAKKAEIDQTPNATDEEKAAAKAKVDEAVTTAKNAIDQATNNAGVDTAKTNGVDSINNVQPTVVKKDEAKTAIENAARAKKAEIDQTPNATDEEKAVAKAKVDEAVTTAKNAIDQATNNNGVDSINNVQPTVVKKDEAKTAIENAARAKKAEIDQTPNATDEEKVAAKAKVDEAVNNAKASIDQVTNNEGVDTAKSNGLDSINNIQPTVVKKDEVKTAIDKAAEAKKTEIDQTPNATDEEKAAAKAKVDEAVTTAKNAIDQATNNAGVDTAKTNGVDSINNVQPTVVKKDEAKTAIENAARAKKAEIDQTPNATDEEKVAAKAKVDEAVNNAKASIDQVTNNEGVDTAKSNGLDSINNIQPTVVKKDEAKTAIDKAAEAKKTEIDQTPNATDEEKAAAKAKVDEAVTTAKNAIDQATNNAGVDTAKTNGVDSINNVQPTVVKKDEAKTAIENAARAKKAEIDQTPNATDEEKVAAKAKVDEAVNNAKASIDQATNNDGVDTAKSNGLDSINNIQPTVVKKDEAKTAIDKAAEAKKAEIDQTPNATDEEKAAAKAKVDEAVTTAKNAIDQATNNDGVDTAKSNGLDSINNIQPTVVKKDEAKAAIDKAAEAKKAEIDQILNATDEEKAAAKAKVDEAVTTAKNAIDQTTNNVGVDAAKESGVESINQVQPAVVKKDQAKAEIDNVAQAKKAEIDRNSNATEEEKVAAKSKVDEAATTIKQAIDKAVNNSEVDNAIDVGKTAINNIEADNSAKSKAIKHLQELVKQQMTKIDSNHLATEEEKAKAKQMIKLLFEKAKIEIEKAKTSYEVTKIDAEYSKLITKTLPENKAKLNVKKKIEKIARQLKNKLNNMNGVSKEEKDRIKVIIEQIVKKSFKDIDLASRNNTINKIVNDVKIQFANIKINKQNNKKSLINNENASVIITTEQHKTNKAYHKVRNEKGRYQLPNTGINNDTSSPLISFTFVSGLFLILRSMRRRASK